ncbi:hypothetical protein [Lysobacter claricitrinus]|uniref:hypothetical protein n=1 Tax=Lysobacter claricitrinus TaxID=3367728 RepID=UPI0037DA82A4
MSMERGQRSQWIAGAALALASVAPAYAQQSLVRAPTSAGAIASRASLAPKAPLPAVILHGAAALPSSLHIKREYDLAELRRQSVITLSAGRANLKPLFANPRAPFNIAERLRTMPQLAEVTVDDTKVLEIDQGLVVHTVVGYRIRPGTCTDSARRAQLARIGVNCFTRLDAATRAAAFANPKDAHFVEDPAKRAAAIERADSKAGEVRARIAHDLATLRASLANPAQRAAIDARLGAGQAARLAALDDTQLEQDVANAGETRVEQVLFVPGDGRADPARFGNMQSAVDFGAVETGRDKKQPGTSMLPGVQKVAVPAVGAAIAAEPADATIDPHVFLTGFTLGRAYEWRERVETTIAWCILGCESTYYAELYAGFDYGFGLRFPLTVGGHYKYPGFGSYGTFAPDIKSINGSTADYAASGLPGPKLFDGKELVAQFGAYAGANYDVPLFGDGNVEFKIGKDFTEGLPAPFTNGQFMPPMPGSDLEGDPIVFDTFDLIGGRANFGVAGGQVFPAVKVGLHSDKLALTLHDNIAGKDIALPAGSAPVKLQVDADSKASDFTIGDPIYNLGFLITPGLDARLFIDVEVWSDHWDWPIWFPELAIELPPGGIDFACHDDTVCTRNYHYGPKVSSQSSESSPVMVQVAKWMNDFNARWEPKCVDDVCKQNVKDASLKAYLTSKIALGDHPTTKYEALAPLFATAEATAQAEVNASQARASAKPRLPIRVTPVIRPEIKPAPHPVPHP